MKRTVQKVYMNRTPKVLDSSQVKRIQASIEWIKERRTALLEILTEITHFHSAQSEIESTLNALQGAAKEVEYYSPADIERMAVFMPSNVLLYSYALYILIPSLYTKSIKFRPSSHVLEQTKKIHEFFSPLLPPEIQLCQVTQEEFMKEYVSEAELVVFTGTYRNAEKIKFQLRKDQMYLFFGQGINQFVIGEKANLAQAVEDSFLVRMFNSGQDCMGPDAFFVHEAVCHPYIRLLEERLNQAVFGSNTDEAADYGPIHYQDILELMAKYFLKHRDHLCYGGSIDFSQRRIEPTIFLSSVEESIPIMEFFCPVFNVIRYRDEEQLKKLFNTSFYRERSMGASLYAADGLIEFMKTKHTVTVNQTLLDIEDGNEPFGGYGMWGNYICHQGRLVSEPLLISKAIADHFSTEMEYIRT